MREKKRIKTFIILAFGALLLMSGCSDTTKTTTSESVSEKVSEISSNISEISDNTSTESTFSESSNTSLIDNESSDIETSVSSKVTEISEDSETIEQSVSETTEVQSEPSKSSESNPVQSSIIISSSAVQTSSETVNRNSSSKPESSVNSTTADNNTNTNNNNNKNNNNAVTQQSSTPAKPSTVAVTKISLNKTSLNLEVGNSEKLSAAISPSNATNKSCTYSSSNKSVASVSSDGTVKALSEGTANITAKSSNGKTAVCKITVYAVPKTVTLNKTSLELNNGETYTLSANTDIDNSKVSFSWNSSNSSVVSVENTTGSKAKITAKNPGTATVTVRTDNGKTASCKITVSMNTDSYVDEVIRIVNEERADNGLTPLEKREDLCRLADIRAKEIVQSFSHTRPDGRSCFSIIEDNNIPYYALGENIAMGQTTPEEVMDSWMNSSGHRENILSSDYNGIGVGCYESNGRLYWVQIFIKS